MIERTKELLIEFSQAASISFGLVASVITVAMAIQDVGKWYFASLSVVMVMLTITLFLMLINRTRKARELYYVVDSYHKIFYKTHNSWHMYKRFIDKMVEDEELGEDNSNSLRMEDMLNLLRKYIVNLISGYREAMRHRHSLLANGGLRVSIKGVCYKDSERLDVSNKESYKEIPFKLKELELFRDPSSDPLRPDDIVDNLDFDENTNAKTSTNIILEMFLH
ncbi:MAG: hypothetical protein ACL93V_15325 [Candidatus Electrothrix sp. YB6]